MALTDTPGQIYVLSDEEEDPRRAIKIFDLEKNEYVETIYQHDIYDVKGALISSQSGDYAGAWYYDDRLKLVYLNPQLQAHYNALNTFFGNKENVNILGFNELGTQAVVHVTAPDNPGEYYFYDYTNKKIDPLFSQNPDVSNSPLGEAKILHIPTRDGKTITAYHTSPANGTDPAAPLIVMPHGGPERRDYFDYDPYVQFLATRGYQIVQINFRGSSGYGKNFAEAGYGEWGGRMQDDITDTVLYLHNNGLAPADRTCIVGASYGGYAALWGVIDTPQLYQCAVSVAGVSDLLADLKRTRKEFGRDSEVFEYWTKSMGHYKDDKEKLFAASPINFVDKINVPTLLVHGKYDDNVKFKQSEALYNKMKKADKNVKFIELDEGHSYWDLESEILYMDELEQFLSTYLPVE